MWVKNAYSLPNPDYEYYRNTGRKLDGSVYAKANLKFMRRFSAYADLQYRTIRYTILGNDDKAGENVDILRHWNFFNPKAGLLFNADGHSAFASFAVAHREPNRDNFTENGPDEQPTFETLFDYEAGYSFRQPIFNVGLNIYYMSYANQLILTGKISEIGEALTSNIPDSYRAGVELTGVVSIARWLRWNANLTLSRNRIRNFTEYVDNYDTGGQDAFRLGSTDIAFSPNVTANSILDFMVNGFSASVTTQYVGRQYMDNTSSRDRSIDPYLVNGLRLGYVCHPKFVKELSVGLTVNNILNEKYETNGWVYSYISEGKRYKDDGYFTQAGTNFILRLTLTI
jgi:iron complex outermembrane receptor protein